MATNDYIDLPSSGGVVSVNGLTGAITLVAGTNISITPSGQNLTIASTATGNVTGPMASTANAIATWSDTSGTKLNDNSGITIDGSGNIVQTSGSFSVGGVVVSSGGINMNGFTLGDVYSISLSNGQNISQNGSAFSFSNDIQLNNFSLSSVFNIQFNNGGLIECDNGGPLFLRAADSSANIQLYNSGILYLANGSGAFIELSGSNIGVNNVSPNYNFDVVGDINCNGSFFHNGNPGVSASGTFTSFTFAGGICTSAS